MNLIHRIYRILSLKHLSFACPSLKTAVVVVGGGGGGGQKSSSSSSFSSFCLVTPIKTLPSFLKKPTINSFFLFDREDETHFLLFIFLFVVFDFDARRLLVVVVLSALGGGDDDFEDGGGVLVAFLLGRVPLGRC